MDPFTGRKSNNNRGVVGDEQINSVQELVQVEVIWHEKQPEIGRIDPATGEAVRLGVEPGSADDA